MRITENQLRSIVRKIIRENKRQQALDEGFFDKVKDFFKGDTKKAVEKVPSLIDALKSAYAAYAKKRGFAGKISVTKEGAMNIDITFSADGTEVYSMYLDVSEDVGVSIQNATPMDEEAFEKVFGRAARAKFKGLKETFNKAQISSKYDAKTTSLAAVKFLEDFIKTIEELAKNPPKN